ncbi:MAG: nucleotide exchange factor GrpE [Candidatus Omnitrophica bacterium]|nr:nucleotide exchange factor GrpE [Candidatus Omnitrophota bacterium]
MNEKLNFSTGPERKELPNEETDASELPPASPDDNASSVQGQAGLTADAKAPVEPASEKQSQLSPTAAATPEQIEEWRAKAAKADEYWDRYLRRTAELDNFRKRAARERMDAVKYANEALLAKLIPVLDNLEMALVAADSAKTGSIESLKTGVSMIFTQIKNLLAEAGLEEIDATNQSFDPNWHEAVSQQESTEAASGQVIQQLRKGYKLRDRLLRPAGVVVAKSPST